MKKLILIAAVLGSALLLNILIVFIYPDVSGLKTKNPSTTAFMEHRQKEWRKKGVKKDLRHKWVPYSRISPYLVRAVIIAEDDKFWKHDGFDAEAMEKAFERNLKAGRMKAGGSTITQQLAKNLYLWPSKTPVRKVKEAILAWRLERHLSKKRILEIYLNCAEWGDGVFGIEAAARHYYGKSAGALGPEEAARLAAVLPNPRRYSPLKSQKYVEKRSRFIYRVMARRGIVAEEVERRVAELEAAPEPFAGPQLDGIVNSPEGEAAKALSPDETAAPVSIDNAPAPGGVREPL